eukprot:GABV01001467.1.p2 GENE.GABV01001467.1~~GABV01001467.1.p2  ORF type:complete len:140 (-),score=42.66 GABV01001467.1:47-466(-)
MLDGASGRTLQRWDNHTDEHSVAAAQQVGSHAELEESADPQDSWAHEDQFSLNERLYKVKSDYSFDKYSSRVDPNSQLFQENLSRAERVSRELSGGGAAVREDQMTEEERFSAVLDGKDKPPAVRRVAEAAAARQGQGS